MLKASLLYDAARDKNWVSWKVLSVLTLTALGRILIGRTLFPNVGPRHSTMLTFQQPFSACCCSLPSFLGLLFALLHLSAVSSALLHASGTNPDTSAALLAMQQHR